MDTKETKPINLILQVGDFYIDEIYGKGTVLSVLQDHYEIKFSNRLKLISKWSEDLSCVEKSQKREKTFEEERSLFLSIPLQTFVFPKRVQLGLESANIKTEGELLNLSDEEIRNIALAFEEASSNILLILLLKKEKKVRIS
jgi:DNA-directed RNA polymerase alpha subunit